MTSPITFLTAFINNIAENIRAVLLYILGFAIVAVIVGALSFYSADASFTFRLIQIAQVIVFMCMGTAHAYLSKKQLSFLQKSSGGEQLFFLVILTLIIFLFLFLLYLIVDSNVVVVAFACSSAFMLPVLLINAWEAHNTLPNEEYSLWYPSEVIIDSTTVSLFLNSITVTVELLAHPGDKEEKYFDITVPGHKTWGRAFDEMVTANNNGPGEQISLTTRSRKQYGWVFNIEGFKKKKRFVDPLLNLPDNNVRQNAIIHAIRIIDPELKRLGASKEVEQNVHQ